MTFYLTPFDTFYLALFLRYLTSNFSEFDLDLWLLEEIWGIIRFSLFESSYTTSYMCSIYLFPQYRTVSEIFSFKHFKVWPWRLIFRSHMRSKMFISIRKPIHDFLSNVYRHFRSISHPSWDILLQIFLGMTLTFDLQRSSEDKHFHTIRKSIYDFLFDFYGHHLLILHRFRENSGQHYECRTEWRYMTFLNLKVQGH